MSFTSWRGSVGLIPPTLRPGGLEDLIRLLPEGFGILPSMLNTREGTFAEYASALAGLEQHVKYLVDAGVDLVHPEGVPLFAVHGLATEQRVTAEWEHKYGVPVMTSGQTQQAAMHALGVHRVVGVSYTAGPDVRDKIHQYFLDAGFDMATFEGMGLQLQEAWRLTKGETYRFVKQLVMKHEPIDGVYMLGSGWRLDVVEALEQDLEIPVIHPVAARAWAIQRRLRVRNPLDGYGRLIAEFPPLPRSG
jgi:maleate cis-trans isomerase